MSESKIDIDKEISKLKAEAVNLLNKMFDITEESSSGVTNRIVECIVSITILEIANLNSKVME